MLVHADRKPRGACDARATPRHKRYALTMGAPTLDDFIAAWNARAALLVDDALAELLKYDACPIPDGVLGQWIRQLEGLHLTTHQTARIVALLGKRDPLLQEAGIKLASRLLDCVPSDAHAVEAPLAKLLSEHPVDPWLLEAVAELLGRHSGTNDPLFVSVHRELAREMMAPPPPRRTLPRGITRARAINPFRTLAHQFEQHVLQRLTPTERELAVLPVLEAEHGTRGFEATQRRILESMGLDVAEHLAVLRR